MNALLHTIVNAQKSRGAMPNDVEEGEEVGETYSDPWQWWTDEEFNVQDTVSIAVAEYSEYFIGFLGILLSNWLILVQW